MDFQRLLLSAIFFFSLFLLWEQWQRDQHPERYQQASQQAASAVAATNASGVSATTAPAAASGVQGANTGAAVPGGEAAKSGRKIQVKTDTLSAEITTVGGTLQRLVLLNHRAVDSDKPFVLMEKRESHVYIAQSGLIGDGMPNHNTEFTSQDDNVVLADGKDSVQVRLTATTPSGAAIVKIYTFHRGSYLIDVGYEIENKGKTPVDADAYFQLVRDDSTPEGDSKFVPTYTGPAVYTDEAKIQKVSFSDIEKNKATFADAASNGWVAMLQHYFVSAWLPKNGQQHKNYVKALDNKQFSAGVRYSIPAVAPGAKGGTSIALYAGPAQSSLDAVAPGLGLTVDYGMLTPISKPLFMGLSYIEGWVHNWGVAIIILTILIKLIFFPLSAASYRSMAKMRVVAPKLQKIKEQYADDRDRLHKAMMELYKTEKINPMGGCLPMLIQIPVFISLYWAILASVELRHAPFFGWITDLSSSDPYFVLPLIMAGSMLLQTKLNPAPPDPLQAKIMQTMPIVFGVVFFFFPAGLVLYSVVNNALSILQQWVITRNAEKDKKPA
ncbi:MAG TPA: membrane protein insertase YidC [Gallionellaceae bacterium]